MRGLALSVLPLFYLIGIGLVLQRGHPWLALLGVLLLLGFIGWLIYINWGFICLARDMIFTLILGKPAGPDYWEPGEFDAKVKEVLGLKKDV